MAHPEQVERFIVAKEPSMKTKTAFWCEDTGFANIFADYRVKDLVEKNSLQGIVFQNVILKKGICSENLFQLISPNILGKECIGMGFGEKIITCPKCGKDIVLRKTKKGRKYFGCEDYPACDFMSWSKPVEKKCPECGGFMVEKGNKLACADEKCGYTETK